MASDIWKKLNLRDAASVVVLEPPEASGPALKALSGIKVQHRAGAVGGATFVLAFVQQRVGLEALAKSASRMPAGDVKVWVAYPKSSSKKHSCDFNRDSGWEAFGAAGFEAVRQVAIDEHWSAVRLRRVGFIKKMTRDPKRSLTNRDA